MKNKIIKHKLKNIGKIRISNLAAVILTAIFIFSLSSCAPVGPKYVKVPPDAPKNWHKKPEKIFKYRTTPPENLAHWWKVFNDGELEKLMEKAVKGNIDLKVAVERVEEARILRGLKKTYLYPTINFESTVSDQRSSENAGEGRENRYYSAGFDAAWELDIFGKTRRSIEAAQANLEATEELLHDVMVTLLAEVATNYIELRTYQKRLQILEKNIEIQRKIYELNKSLYDAGVIGELPLKQSLSILEETRSQIHPIKNAISTTKNTLSMLIGEKPGSLDKELEWKKDLPHPPETILMGIPINTLRSRPDVRRAERILAYETALIGVEKADLYPTFNLSGTFDFSSIDVGSIFKWGSRSWNIGANIFWKIFNAGATRKKILMQTSRQKQALLNYKSVVLKALKEIENAMISYSREIKHEKSLEKALKSTESVLSVAEENYRAGISDYINVLDAERSLQEIEDQLMVSKGKILVNLIHLYKVLGGGWEWMNYSNRGSGKNEKGEKVQAKNNLKK